MQPGSATWELKKTGQSISSGVVSLRDEEDLQSEASGQVEDPEDESYPPTETSSFGCQLRYNCSLCGFNCLDEDELLEHLNTQHSNSGNKGPLQCGFCSFSTDENVVFEEHIQNHRVFKPFQCAHCGYKNFSRSKVKLHCMKVHSDLPIMIVEQAQTFETPKKHTR